LFSHSGNVKSGLVCLRAEDNSRGDGSDSTRSCIFFDVKRNDDNTYTEVYPYTIPEKLVLPVNYNNNPIDPETGNPTGPIVRPQPSF
jgi:hypothetical protein